MFNLLTNAVESTAPETTEVVNKAMEFSTERLPEALLCSVAGMVGIFIVVGVIILSVSILNKAGADRKKD